MSSISAIDIEVFRDFDNAENIVHLLMPRDGQYYDIVTEQFYNDLTKGNFSTEMDKLTEEKRNEYMDKKYLYVVSSQNVGAPLANMDEVKVMFTDLEMQGWYKNYTKTNFAKKRNQSDEPENYETKIQVKFDSLSESIKKFSSVIPESIIISALTWKTLIRNVLRAEPVLMFGPSGIGKTTIAKVLAETLDRKCEIFNLGETQDPRPFLIGTNQIKDGKTYFVKSRFIEAIQTPNTVVILDEISRANPDAWNILMSALDVGQKYVTITESDTPEVIRVADGVTFVATANIGMEYTSTNVLDKALMDRFTAIPVGYLNQEEEYKLLKSRFPSLPEEILDAISKITNKTREECKNDSPKIDFPISSRTSLRMAAYINDGFTFEEAIESVFLSQYPDDGGTNSQKNYVLKMSQGFAPDNLQYS